MPQERPVFDLTRRDVLKRSGQGLLLSGLLAAPTFGAVPLAPPEKQSADAKMPPPRGKKSGWAIVGLGKLALEEVMPAFAECEHSRPVALVSGHPDKAKKIADRYAIDPKNILNYDNFDRLADMPDVDVVYIILPNHLHAQYTIRALKAGKHVLCEKPMASNAAEAESMVAAQRQTNKKLMIAYRLRYEPYNQAVIEMAQKKAYGDIRMIEASNIQDVKAPNIRLSKETAGGAMMDIGIYCLNAARYITGEEPTEVSAWTYSNPKDERFREVEEKIAFHLRFPSGVIASCNACFSAAESRRYRVMCDKGWIDLENAFAYRGQRLHVCTMEEKTEKKELSELSLRPVNHFASEMDYFSQCVQNDSPVLTPGEEGLRDMKLIDLIFRAARESRTLQVS